MSAANRLAERGVEAEVIDLRTLRPLDSATVVESVRKTHRCLVVEETWQTGAFGAHLAQVVQQEAFDTLDGPVGHVGGVDVPSPYARNLEPPGDTLGGDDTGGAAGAVRSLASRRRRRSLGYNHRDAPDGLRHAGRRVVKWLKQEGEEIARGEDVAEIETDKAVIPVPATEGGVLRKVLVSEGSTVPVGQVIAVMTAPEEELPADLAGLSATQPSAEAPPAPAATKPSPPPVAAPSTTEVRATPLARRLASEKSVDLTKVTGTGPRGRITEKDVLAYADSQASAAPAETAAAAPPRRSWSCHGCGRRSLA